MTDNHLKTSADLASEIQSLIAKEQGHPDAKAFFAYMQEGIGRVIGDPVKTTAKENGGECVEIFEHYLVECGADKSSPRLCIKYGMSEDTSSVFEPYVHGMVEEQACEKNTSGYTRSGAYKWIFDIRLDNRFPAYDSFITYEHIDRLKLDYFKIAMIVKAAAYFGGLRFIDHDALMFLNSSHPRNETLEHEKHVEFKLALKALLALSLQNLQDEYSSFIESHEDSEIHAKIKESLNQICSPKTIALYNLLTQVEERHSGNRVNKTLRISRIVYVADRLAPYMDRINELAKYSEAQLYYMLSLQTDIEQINNQNFFSYQSILKKSDADEAKFKFPNKTAFRNFSKMKISVLKRLFQLERDKSILDSWWVQSTDEYNAAIGLHDEGYNEFIWELLMTWLSHGKRHADLIFNEKTELKIMAISNLLNDMHWSVVLSLELCGKWEGVSPLCRSVNLALAVDLFCDYFDHQKTIYDEGMKPYHQKLEDYKAKYGDTETDEINAFERKLKKQIRKPLRDEFKRRMDELGDFLTEYDYEWKEFVNLAEIDRTTTIRSIERKIERWHGDQYKFSEEEIADAKEVVYPKMHEQITYKGCIITPIQSYGDLMLEGMKMQHCVATFHQRVNQGQYQVYQLLYGEERATLGIDVRDAAKPFRFSQCYKEHNHSVSSELSEIAYMFVDYLNSNQSKSLPVRETENEVN